MPHKVRKLKPVNITFLISTPIKVIENINSFLNYFLKAPSTSFGRLLQVKLQSIVINGHKPIRRVVQDY